MDILKIKPACKDYIWGGDRLKKDYGVESDLNPLAEAWVLSCHPEGLSLIDESGTKGRTLKEYIDEKGPGVLGKNAASFKTFPMLVKLIDAAKDLSIQVHPDDEYALKHENENGKTEFWYILDSAKDAYIYLGFKKSISDEEFRERIKNNSILEVLNRVPVKKGDVFFIEPGTLHAIGGGTVLAEVQQNSNLTYRIYDYGRKGPDGKERTLHIDKALDVTRLKPAAERKSEGNILAQSRYFVTRLADIEGSFTLDTSEDSFTHVLVVSGEGSLSSGEEKESSYKKGDSFFIPAVNGSLVFKGDGEMLISVIP